MSSDSFRKSSRSDSFKLSSADTGSWGDLGKDSSSSSEQLSSKSSQDLSELSVDSIDYSLPAIKNLKEFEQNIYRVDKVLNNFEKGSDISKLPKLNLLNLLQNIPMLYTVNKNSNGKVIKVNKTPGEGIASGYLSSINKDSQFTYHRPPIGPIESIQDKIYLCIYCNNKSGEYHEENCLRPEKSSLVNKDDLSRQYTDDFKKKGTFKLISKRETGGVLPNTLSLNYRSETIGTIKIDKNGKIIVTGIPLRLSNSIDSILENLINSVHSKVSENNSILTDEYKNFLKFLPMLKNKFKINPSISYINTLKSQSYMTDEDIKMDGNYNVLIDFDKVHQILKTFLKTGKYSFPLGINYTKYQKSKKGQESRNMIRFYVNVENFKIHVQIESHGSIQMIFSLCKDDNIKKKMCKELSDSPISSKIFKKFHNDLMKVLKKNKHEYLQIHEILNKLTVSKKNKAVYTNPLLEGVKLVTQCAPIRRANPNVFKHYSRNHCVTKDHLMMPYGVFNKTHKLWEPCCFKKVSTKLADYKNAILYGLPSEMKPRVSEKIMNEFNISLGDDKVNTTTFEDRKIKGIADFDRKQIYKCLINVITESNNSSGSESSGGSLRSMISHQTKRSMATIDTSLSSRISKKLKKYKDSDFTFNIIVNISKDSTIKTVNRFTVNYPIFMPNSILRDHIDLSNTFIEKNKILNNDKLSINVSSLRKELKSNDSENEQETRKSLKLTTVNEFFENMQKIYLLKFYKIKESFRSTNRFGIINKSKTVKPKGFRFMNKILINNSRKPL
jgi:hypothetical protein